MTENLIYVPTDTARSQYLQVRGSAYHMWIWGDLSAVTPEAPLTVMAHGWMDVGASFQFLVDALRKRPGWAHRPVVALDWRGFGQTYVANGPEASGDYAYLDYLADLDALLDQLSPEQPVDLLGHSMGGNVVMLYAGVRPGRIRRLVNLEGFGMPGAGADAAPKRLTDWLDGLKAPVSLKGYDSVQAVAERLRQTNPLLRTAFAMWLAQRWAREENGRWQLNADAAHKRPGPHIYRVEEVLACWAHITAPLLFVEGDKTPAYLFFKGQYTREAFQTRLERVRQVTQHSLSNAGHMVHHDQPEALAGLLASFLNAPDAPN